MVEVKGQQSGHCRAVISCAWQLLCSSGSRVRGERPQLSGLGLQEASPSKRRDEAPGTLGARPVDTLGPGITVTDRLLTPAWTCHSRARV